MPNEKPPMALYDSVEYFQKTIIKNNNYLGFCLLDYQETLSFLDAYKGRKGTFNAYRRETERLLHWTWIFLKKKLPDLKRDDIESYIKFLPISS